MATESIVLRRVENRANRIGWDTASPLHREIETRTGKLTVKHGRFRGGLSEGVEIVRLENDHFYVDVLPTRGMSLWRMQSGKTRFGWQSPVSGPVHPDRIARWEPSGLGWLDGFDELLVRCGLESNGAPDYDDHGRLRYPLHGHIGNTPADSLSIEYDEACGRIDLIGEMIESRMFTKRWRLRTRVRMHADRAEVELLDDITNELGTPAKMQLLYHINIGAPVLGKGSELVTALDELAPRDDLSAQQLDHWNQFEDPSTEAKPHGYYARPLVDESDQTQALLVDPKGETALSLSYKSSLLPYFTLWKNPVDLADGYVTSLQPATNFPNRYGFEAGHGRCLTLAAGQTKSFRLKLQPMTDAAKIKEFASRIRSSTTGGDGTKIHRQPIQAWTDLDSTSPF